MTPSPPRILPLTLQVDHLTKLFSKLNPDIDPQEIDWDITGKGPLDPTATYRENHQNMENAYPQYKWFETYQDRAKTKEEAIEEYAQFLDYLLGLAILPEAKEEMKPVLEKALSDYRYRTERDMEKTTLRKTVKKLERQLLETKKTGKPQTGIIEKETRIITRETERRKVRMTKDLERKLRDIFEASFTREGLSPRRFMAEYRLDLPSIKTLTKEDDMIKAVEELARDILTREKTRKIRPPRVRPPPPERPPTREIRIGLPPDEEEDEEEYIPTITPAFPPEPLSPTPFPRNLSPTEKDQIWRAFADELAMRGIASLQYRKQFDDWLGTFTFKTWRQVRNHFENLLEQIQTGKPVLFPLHSVIIPWETTEEAVIHFTAIGIYETLDEMITKLYSYGFDTTDEEVRKIIIEQYKKGNRKLIRVPKENLESLIAQKIE